jgi:hypothetical protein
VFQRLRYILAIVVALLLIGLGALYVHLTLRSFEDQVRQALRQQQQNGELPAELQGVDLETVEIGNFQMRIPPGMEFRLELAHFLTEYWYVGVVIVVAGSLAVAALVSRWTSRA